MTTFGWDASSWDDPPTSRDGIDFYTHKITDGDHYYADPEYAAAMAAGRGLGYPVMGAYHVLHGQRSLTSQAAWWISEVTRQTPWWRELPAFIWQVDAEPFGYNTTPTIDEINSFGDAVCHLAQIPASAFVAYAPAWVYGSKLTGLRYRQWASSYGSNPTGGYRQIYPGDTAVVWRTGPIEPLILQYGSRATIAGQTTSDANAYRGTIQQLIAALGGRSEADMAAVVVFDSSVPGVPPGLAGRKVITDGLHARVVPLSSAVTAVLMRMGLKAADTDVVTITGADVASLTAAGWDFGRIFGSIAGLDVTTISAIFSSQTANEAADAARDAAISTLINNLNGLPGAALTDAQLKQITDAVGAAAASAAQAAGDASQAAILARLEQLHAEEAAAAQAAADALKASLKA